jgi:hypothetical protein
MALAQLALQMLRWALQLHPMLSYLFGFLVPLGLSYWFFVLGPYCRGQTEAMLSPWRVRRPAVPGVLEQYLSWKWDRLRQEELAAGTETNHKP